MLLMSFEDGLHLLKSALSRTRGILRDSTHFLYIAHAYYAGWLEKDNKWPSIFDDPELNIYDIAFVEDRLQYLRNFISSDKSNSVAFLRPGFDAICKSYESTPSSFKDLYDLLRSIPVQWFDENWEKAFDTLLSQIYQSGGKSGAEFCQPRELTALVSILASTYFRGKGVDGDKVYDPFAGTSSFLKPGSDSYSQEVNEEIYALGRLRTLALGYDPGASQNYVLSDCTKSWADNKDGVKSFDSIVSFPPLGMMVPVTKEMGIKWPAKMISLEDYFLCKGSDSLNPGGHLIGVMLNNVLFREGSTGKQRERLVREKRVKAVIQLPSNLLYNIGVSICLIVLTDKTNPNDEILFMDASTLFVKDKRRNVLQVEEVLNILLHRYYARPDEQFDSAAIAKYTISVPVSDVIAKECSLSPSRYLMAELEDNLQIPEGYEALPLQDLVTINNGSPISIDAIRTIRGRDLIADGPIQYETFDNLEPEPVDGRIIALDHDAILVLTVGNLKPTLFKVQEDEPVALRSNVVSLIPKEGIDPYYLVSELRKPYVTEQVEHLSEGSVIPHLRNRDLLSIRVIIPVERSLQHEAFLTSQRLEKEQQLKSLQFDEYIKRERGRLDAMMSIRRHRINPYISGLQNNVSMLLDELFSNEKLTASSEISPNYSVQDALENMEENLVELKNLFDAFTVDTNVGIAESIDLVAFLKHYNYTRKMPDRQFSLEKYLFEKSEHYPNIVFNGSNLTEVLDEIIHNAEKHFIPNTPDCAVWLSLRLNGKDVQLLILNNGEPVPADFDEERSFVAGYHKDEKGTGQGLFRVRQLCDEFGAKIAWENDPDSIMATGLCITFKTSLD